MLNASNGNHRTGNRTPTPGLALNTYCSQLGSLLERRYTEIALVEAKRRAERAAAMAKEAMLRAQAADRAKTTFLANMSHELRTPLNAIIGFSELMKLKPDRHDPEHVECILEAGRHLLTIVCDVLDLARVEAGKVELVEEIVSIRELVSAAVRAVLPLAEKKSIGISYAAEADEDTVLGDPVRLKQVFVNLLSNAIKFSPEGAQIRIASRAESGGGLKISFTDTGIGIPEEQLQAVLEPFERVGEHMTRGSEGTGLGLPIARALVKLHGGDLVLESEVGVGTTAEVRIPADRIRAGAAVLADARCA